MKNVNKQLLERWAAFSKAMQKAGSELPRHLIAETEQATAQALALKAAKAMQQAETERADANERDAERYRWLRSIESRGRSDMFVRIEAKSIGEWWQSIAVDDKLDDAIDQAMSNM